MRTRRAARARSSGLSLLEMMVATAMMAALMSSVVVVMRSGYAVWNAQEADLDVLENGYGVLRHFAQQVRQAEQVTALTGPGDPAGSLTILSADTTPRSWTHGGASKVVHFNNGSGDELLARHIDALSFAGYKADGVTPTAVAEEIQVVRCTVEVTLPRGGGQSRTISCRAWIRTW